MKIELIHNTPLWIASRAIRKCWSSEDKSDTTCTIAQGFGEDDISGVDLSLVNIEHATDVVVGTKDKELMHRVGNKNKHASTLEHINYTFDIDGISRACLQELARHRHASMSVKSTRYTLKELKEEKGFVSYQNGGNYNILKEQRDRAYKYIVTTGVGIVDDALVRGLEGLRVSISNGVSNDKAKYSLPEAYKTSLVWTINMRSLQNFLALRTNKAALWEIRDLAYEIYKQLPEDHKYMFTEFIYEEK